MKTFAEYLQLAAKAHGHTCAGQVMGVRLAMMGLRELGIEDPIKDRKRLITSVEIDRCATDAVSLVTGCRLGKRALKYVDYGKVAATFLDLQTGRAIRIVAKESSKQRAREMFPELDKEQGQRQAYRVLPDAELFEKQPVRIRLDEKDMPAYRGPRVICSKCGEGINFGRERMVGGNALCRACAGEAYYELLP